MQRQTAAVQYLTLEDAAGTSVLGVTAEHPLYDASAGWTEAEKLVAGDIVHDSMLAPLTVLALRVDDTPQLVHNLEVGGAHTYFAGEMAAWAHNAGRSKIPTVPNSMRDRTRCFTGDLAADIFARDPNCVYCGAPSQVGDHFISHSHGGRTSFENGRGCCRSCNLAKSNMTPLEFWKFLNGFR